MYKKFATAINCVDGRVQLPVIAWVKEKYQVDYVDMITEPGPDKLLSENKQNSQIELVKKKVEISLKKHGSKLIVLAGHHDCAGNPVDEKRHREEILNGVKVIKSWNLDAKVLGVWVNSKWIVSRIAS